MENNTIGITTAIIRGLKKEPYYFNHHCFWAWDIRFEEKPFFSFLDLCRLYMGETKEEAWKTYLKFKKIFSKHRIFDGDRVGVIYDKDGIIAIGRSNTDSWIHVRDRFKTKTFKQLNLNLESLVVATTY